MQLLIATGGAAHSYAAVRLGAALAQPPVESVTVLTVIQHEAARQRAAAVLEQARQLLPSSEVEIRTLIRRGNPAEEIISQAITGHADLIVLGEKQSHNMMTRFLGSTARRVVTQAPCPVVVAKGKIGPVSRILLCDSGAAGSALVDRFTGQLTIFTGADVDITVLHVMSQMSAGPGVAGQQLRATAQELIQARAPEGELLERNLQYLERVNIHPDAKVRHGLVVDEILREARSGDYDLIVIGAHYDAGWLRFLLEDLADQIITQADRPVLVLR